MKDDVVFRCTCLVIPVSLQNRVLQKLHDGHPGIVRMKQLYREMYFWPNGSTEVEEFVNSCQACAMSGKTSVSEKVPDGAYSPPDGPWQRVCIDICGPFWTAPSHQEYVVVVMDHFSSWVEYLLSGDVTSGQIIKWLKIVFGRLGNPLELISDNGPQFTSDQFAEFLAAKSIKHTLTPVYCPQRNGKVERFNHVLKHGAQTFGTAGMQFGDGVHRLVTSFQATAPDGGKSPATLLRGWQMRTDADIWKPLLLDKGLWM